MNPDIATSVTALLADRTKINRSIRLHNDRIGTLECLKILSFSMKVAVLRERIDSLTSELTEEGLIDKPLLIVTSTSGTYQVRLARADQLIAGEYLSIDELAKIASHGANFLSNMNKLEEQLILNSLQIYSELNTHLKNTYTGKRYNGLTKSKKCDYLYFYLPDKKHSLKFVAEKIEFTN